MPPKNHYVWEPGLDLQIMKLTTYKIYDSMRPSKNRPHATPNVRNSKMATRCGHVRVFPRSLLASQNKYRREF
jgi:hypothetical protein